MRLQKISASSPKGQSYLDQIIHETNKLETMIRRLEEYVHIPKPIYGKENLHEVVETALQYYFKEATEHGISMTVETKGGDGDLFIDRDPIFEPRSLLLRRIINLE